MNILTWYPPAETEIPLKAVFHALSSRNGNLENVLCTYLEGKPCTLGGSGRSVLALLLQVLGKRRDKVQARQEVLIPGYTCYSVAASVVRAGHAIRAYDIDPETFEPDIDSVMKGINENTLAIIVQHIFGVPIPMEGIRGIARKQGVYLIEDAAQGLGGSINGEPLGTLGDFGILSFGRGKPIPLGVGGALISKDNGFASEIDFANCRQDRGSILKDLSMILAARILTSSLVYGLLEALPLGLGETVFDPDFSVRPMSDIMKRIGGESFPHLETLNAHRRFISEIYVNSLKREMVYPLINGARPVYTRFPVKTSSKPISRCLARLGARRMYPRAIVDEPVIQRYLAKDSERTPGASRTAETLITLPTHRGISGNLAKHIAGETLKWLN